MGAVNQLFALGGKARIAKVGLLTLIVAASEGLGFVLLVPLLGKLGGGATRLPGGGIVSDWPLGLLLAAFALLVTLRALAEIWRGLAAQSLAVAVVDGLRQRAVAALVGSEWRWLAATRRSEHRAQLISSVDRVGDAVHFFADLLRIALALGALAVAALVIEPLAAAIGAAAGAGALIVLGGLRRRARLLGEALSQRYRTIHHQLEEALDAVRLIKSFGRERRSIAEIAATFAGMRRVERAYIRDSALARAGLQIAAAIALALAIWLTVERWDLALAMLLPLTALAVRAVPLLGSLQQTAQEWSHASPALDEALALIAEAEAHAEPLPGSPAPRLRKAIVLDQVCFGHAPGRAALSGIDAVIPAGAIAALTGPSGAGKSTLADLVGGLLAPDSGRVLVDGIALEGGLRTAWRARIAYVQQEPVLFAGSVRDNLLWAAPEADEAALHEVLTRASAEFVHAFPGGLDCDLGAAGRALSGGERQRIALARALLRQPDLLILDEATSALDDDSEAAIAAAVAALAGHCTVVVIGHRGALTALASHRIALDNGRLARS